MCVYAWYVVERVLMLTAAGGVVDGKFQLVFTTITFYIYRSLFLCDDDDIDLVLYRDYHSLLSVVTIRYHT